MPVKMCCYFKNSEYLEQIIDIYSQFDISKLKDTLDEEIISKFEIREIINYEYLEGKRKIEYHNYR